jgi:hypothetical protein
MQKFLQNSRTVALVILPVLLLALLAISIVQRSYAEPLFIHSTYYFLLVMVCCWAGTYLITARGLTKAKVVDWVKENKAGVLIALGITLISALAIHPALRVLSDETNLLGTSKNFFFSKVATFTTTGNGTTTTFGTLALSSTVVRRSSPFWSACSTLFGDIPIPTHFSSTS